MSLCLAFIRYHAWLRKCDNGLAGKPEFRRDHDEYRPTTLLDWLQPLVAWIGLVGCILVFGFVSATWWDTKVSFAKVAVAYGAVSASGSPHNVNSLGISAAVLM